MSVLSSPHVCIGCCEGTSVAVADLLTTSAIPVCAVQRLGSAHDNSLSVFAEPLAELGAAVSHNAGPATPHGNRFKLLAGRLLWTHPPPSRNRPRMLACRLSRQLFQDWTGGSTVSLSHRRKFFFKKKYEMA